jgi:trehalose 6-phosphate synthase/phosphatase
MRLQRISAFSSSRTGCPSPSPGTKDIEARLAALRTVPIDLSAEEVDVFYGRISNAVLWPLCHDRLDRLPLRVTGWDVYEKANARFADAVAEVWRPGDLVWVHDYQLLRVPRLLRERVPEARIGFFLHIPFPNPEIFFALPTRRWLVEGMLGADIIGFHTRRYRGHFTAALRRLLSIEAAGAGTFTWDGREITLGVYPMGVDASTIAEQAGAADVEAAVDRFTLPGHRLLVGIDRLDYSKGIPRRLLALEQLLLDRPEWRERIRLVQVAVPSRGNVGAYREFRHEIDALVGRINGAFSTPNWSPIHYLHRSIPSTTLLALYRAADVMLVTPLRDGMNLVAKEFIASRIDDDGVLLLSEFAGAVDELPDAVVVNPYDVDEMAASMHRALTMDPAERKQRMHALRARVAAWDVHRWVESFLAALAPAGAISAR